MNFERLRIQEACERIVGCTSLSSWNSYRESFESLALIPLQVQDLKTLPLDDAEDFFFKGVLSLSEAIHSFSRRLYSWGVVKAYYSVFYFLRSSLALRGCAIVRNKSLYLLKIENGQSPQKKSSNRYRNDHVCVINVYRDLYENSDKLQSNAIDGENPYEWLMQRRHQINYRQRQFNDPDPPDFLKLIATKVDSQELDLLIASYVDDPSYLFCFQPEHACLALPIKRLLLTKQELSDEGKAIHLSKQKADILRSLLVIDSKPISNVEIFV